MRIQSFKENNVNNLLNEKLLIEIIRSSVRLIRTSNEFGNIWDWSCFYTFISHPNQSLSYFSSLALFLRLGISNQLQQSITSHQPPSISSQKLKSEIEEGMNELEESVLSSLELILSNECSVSQQQENNDNNNNNDKSVDSKLIISGLDFPSQFVDVCGVILTTHFTAKQTLSSIQSNDFVYTKTSKQNIREVGLCLSNNKPILLAGESGCGKSAIINELARRTGNLEDIVILHLGEETDSKSLIGTYVSTEGFFFFIFTH
jgi:midasin